MGVEPGLDEDEDEDGVEDGGLNFKQSSRQAHWHRRHRRRISFQTRLRFNVLLLKLLNYNWPTRGQDWREQPLL